MLSKAQKHTLVIVVTDVPARWALGSTAPTRNWGQSNESWPLAASLTNGLHKSVAAMNVASSGFHLAKRAQAVGVRTPLGTLLHVFNDGTAHAVPVRLARLQECGRIAHMLRHCLRQGLG